MFKIDDKYLHENPMYAVTNKFADEYMNIEDDYREKLLVLGEKFRKEVVIPTCDRLKLNYFREYNSNRELESYIGGDIKGHIDAELVAVIRNILRSNKFFKYVQDYDGSK